MPDKSVPAGVARVAAAASERIWRLLKRPGPPPLTRFAVWVSSQECTIDISRAERELGYRPGHLPRGRPGRAQVVTAAPTRLTKKRLKRPIEISSPSSSSASSTRSPLRNTPFRLRSSRMRAPLSSR